MSKLISILTSHGPEVDVHAILAKITVRYSII